MATSRTDLTIRPAGEADVDVIVDMWLDQAALHSTFDARRWRFAEGAEAEYRKYVVETLGKPEGLLLVVEDGGGAAPAVVGYLLGMLVETPPTMACRKRGEVRDIFIREPWRGGGTGRRLMEMAFADFRQRGAEECQLFVACRNEAAQRFYERLGMRPVAQQMCIDL